MGEDYDVHSRLQDIMDEAFGPFPTEPVEWLLTKLEEKLFEMRREAVQIARALGVCYEADGVDCEPGPLKDLLERVNELSDLEREHIDEVLPQDIDTWHEDDGEVLWWSFPVVQPPYVGSPLDDDFPGDLTHWTRIRVPIDPMAEGRD